MRNEVTRTAGGSLRFGEMNAARTPGTPAWLGDLRASGIAQFRLEVNPRTPQQNSPASIMMLASDYWDTDIAIEQDHTDLLVWLRRTGSDANGDPPVRIRGALPPRRWSSVDVLLRPADIRVAVDGKSRLAADIPAGSLRLWGPGELVLGNEVHGGRPWQGEISHAEVRTSTYAVDYARPGALPIPEHFLYLPDHIERFPLSGVNAWLSLVFHVLSFIPLGFLLAWTRRPPVSVIPVTLLATALAVLLAAGKFLFLGRHMAVADIPEQAAGAFVGAFLASSPDCTCAPGRPPR